MFPFLLLSRLDGWLQNKEMKPGLSLCFTNPIFNLGRFEGSICSKAEPDWRLILRRFHRLCSPGFNCTSPASKEIHRLPREVSHSRDFGSFSTNPKADETLRAMRKAQKGRQALYKQFYQINRFLGSDKFFRRVGTTFRGEGDSTRI